MGLFSGEAPNAIFEYSQVIWAIHGPIRLSLLSFAWTRNLYKACMKKRLLPGLSVVFVVVFVFVVLTVYVVCAEGGDPSLEDILNSDLGFAYFYEHLRREYSEENLVCTCFGVCFNICLSPLLTGVCRCVFVQWISSTSGRRLHTCRTSLSDTSHSGLHSR